MESGCFWIKILGDYRRCFRKINGGSGEFRKMLENDFGGAMMILEGSGRFRKVIPSDPEGI